MGEESKFKPTKTKYEGVYYIMGTSPATNKPEKIFYISYYRDGKRYYEKAGRAGQDDMTASRASRIRGRKIDGLELPNVERRKAERAAKEAAAGKWTFNRLWKAWQEDKENAGKRGTQKADQRYRKHIATLPEGEEDPKGEPPRLGNREPSDLKPLDIDRLRLYLAKDHAKSTTISVLGLIRRIERYGASTGRCPGLTFPIILKGKALGNDPRVKRSPSDEQMNSYIETCATWPDIQAGNFGAFVAHTGIRRGSVRDLKWEDLYIDNKENLIALLRDSKTGDVPIVLSDKAVLLLRNHPRTEGNPYIFTGRGPDGKRSQREIDRIPRMIANAAGLPSDLDPCHCFRRRLATRMKKFGTKVGMTAGGWRSPAMLLHYQSTDSEEVLAALNEASETA
jgi:integrase